ncbi:MAG: hypothetical protein HY673_06045 [Chloroflexi bacterium]|nr:hypothetical protein [Chloroflexota bacterium]
MRQEHCERAAPLLGNTEDMPALKRGALVLGLAMMAVLLAAALLYFPFHGFMVREMPAGDPAAAISVEGTLGADYVLQTDFVSGRYAIPFLVSFLVAGAILLWVLRSPGEVNRD